MIRVSKNIYHLLSLNRTLTSLTNNQIKAYFVQDKSWKERDEAAERIYISKQQKQMMKKMLQKFGSDMQGKANVDDQFQRRLEQVLARYKIDNKSFAAQILNLHKDL